MPKNNFTWDLDIILQYLKQLSLAKEISQKLLTLKRVTTSWLLTGQRSQSLKCFDTKNITIPKGFLINKIGGFAQNL